MGNVLRSTRKVLTEEQFKEYLNLLKGITYKLLLKRHIDVAVTMQEKIQTEDTDHVDGITAGDILAKIRFKNTKPIWQYAGPPVDIQEYNSTEVNFSDEMMDSNPRKWTIGQLIAGMDELEKCRQEFFGSEIVVEPPQTKVDKRTAAMQATLAVFKTVFAQLPTEQPPPQPVAEPEPIPTDSQNAIPVDKNVRKTRQSRSFFPVDYSEVVKKIQSLHSHVPGVMCRSLEDLQNNTFTDFRRIKKDVTPKNNSSKSKTSTEKTKGTKTSSKQSFKRENKSSKETKARRRSSKKFSKTKSSDDGIIPGKKISYELFKSIKNIEPLGTVTNTVVSDINAEGKRSSLDIPAAPKEKTSPLVCSDSLSDAFSVNPISVLTRKGTVHKDTPSHHSNSMLDDIITKSIDPDENSGIHPDPESDGPDVD